MAPLPNTRVRAGQWAVAPPGGTHAIGMHSIGAPAVGRACDWAVSI